MKRRRRHLSRDEETLWNQVAKTVAPLPERAATTASELEEPKPARPPRTGRPPRQAPPASPGKPPRSPFETGDPRRERQVARGRIPIDGVLDLHGMTQDEADRATVGFIGASVRRQRRVVLVITGKGERGGHAGEGRGVLRRRFLQAVEAGLYGGHISSVRPAHQRHGGGGAFYVFLKTGRSKVLNRNTVIKPSLSPVKRPR